MSKFSYIFNIDEFKQGVQYMKSFGHSLEDHDFTSPTSYSEELLQNVWFRHSQNILDAIKVLADEEIDITTDNEYGHNIISHALSQIPQYVIEQNLDIFAQALPFDQVLARLCKKVSPLKIFRAYEGKVDFAEEVIKLNPLDPQQILLYTPFTSESIWHEEAIELVEILSNAGVNFASPNPDGHNQMYAINQRTGSSKALELMAKTTSMEDMLSGIGSSSYVPEVCKIFDEMGQFDLAALERHLEYFNPSSVYDIAQYIKDLSVYGANINQILAKPCDYEPNKSVLSKALTQNASDRPIEQTIEILAEAGADFSITNEDGTSGISYIAQALYRPQLEVILQYIAAHTPFDKALVELQNKVCPLKIFRAYEGKVDFAEEVIKLNPLDPKQILLYAPFTSGSIWFEEATELVEILSNAGVNFATPNPNGCSQTYAIHEKTLSTKALELMAKTTSMEDILSGIRSNSYVPEVCKIFDEMGQFDLAALERHLEYFNPSSVYDIAQYIKDLSVYGANINQILAKPCDYEPNKSVLSKALTQNASDRPIEQTIEILAEAGADFSILGQDTDTYMYTYEYSSNPLYFRLAVLSGIIMSKGPDEDTVSKLARALEQYDLGSNIQASGSLVACLIPFKDETSEIGQIAQRVFHAIEDLTLTDERGISLAKHIIEHTSHELMDETVEFCLTHGVDSILDMLKSDGSNADLLANKMIHYQQFGCAHAIVNMYDLDTTALFEALLLHPAPSDPLERQQYELLANKLIYSFKDLDTNSSYLEQAMQLHNVTIIKIISDLLEGTELSDDFTFALKEAVTMMPNFKETNIVKSMVEHLLNPDAPLTLEAPHQLLAIEWHNDEV